MSYIHIIEYYSIIKRNEELTHTMRMNLENIMLTEGYTLYDSIYEMSKTGKYIKTDSRFSSCQNPGEDRKKMRSECLLIC